MQKCCFIICFLIGKKKNIIEARKAWKIHKVHNSEQWGERDKNKRNYHETILRDKRKSLSVEQSKRPQHRDRSKSVQWHKSNNWAKNIPLFSKEHRFCSVQIVHIKQLGTKFQMSELCFPSQWYQQKNKTVTEPDMTQSIPNSQSIHIHKEWATGQEINKWSTDSSLQQYIQQQFAKVQPQSIRLSKIKI